jgi:hypothetical protein
MSVSLANAPPAATQVLCRAAGSEQSSVWGDRSRFKDVNFTIATDTVGVVVTCPRRALPFRPIGPHVFSVPAGA